MQGSASPHASPRCTIARTHAPRMNRNSWKQVPFARTHACTRACVRSFPESNPIQSNPILILVVTCRFSEASGKPALHSAHQHLTRRDRTLRGVRAHIEVLRARVTALRTACSPEGVHSALESRSRSGAQGTGRSAGTLILSLPQRGRGGVVDGRTLARQNVNIPGPWGLVDPSCTPRASQQGSLDAASGSQGNREQGDRAHACRSLESGLRRTRVEAGV
ncbi:hypothetical protein OH76DRAFT_849620 [Lentinus brumalis]|uniref:Uncharacterized protein n=1 Tax=Lentinus brumalis TaxID=2498619 RepID=A0A371DQW8_9APHY|nr:hypothetical protein OH76DRAFT_849620 [Polyporus brumalis]